MRACEPDLPKLEGIADDGGSSAIVSVASAMPMPFIRSNNCDLPCVRESCEKLVLMVRRVACVGDSEVRNGWLWRYSLVRCDVCSLATVVYDGARSRRARGGQSVVVATI